MKHDKIDRDLNKDVSMPGSSSSSGSQGNVGRGNLEESEVGASSSKSNLGSSSSGRTSSSGTSGSSSSGSRSDSGSSSGNINR